MSQGTMRRALAAASATAMAGAALVVGGAGVASAATATEKGMTATRTVSNVSPVHGETIKVTTEVKRSGSNAWLLYWIKDHRDPCLSYVPDSLAWTVSGKAYNKANNWNGAWDDVTIGQNFVEINPFAANSWIPPVVATADYVVNCDAGPIDSGGVSWDSTWFALVPPQGGEVNKPQLGPQINVQRASIEQFFLAAPGTLEVNKPATLTVDTSAPAGSTVTFKVEGQTYTATVADGRATASWTPQSAGAKTITAELAQTATHLGKTASRPVEVAAQVADSNVAITAPAAAQVGVAVDLTAKVSPAAAGGTVTFREQGMVIGSATVPATGEVTISWIPGAEGERSIDAEFSGRPGVKPSAALGVKVDVAPKAVDMQVSTTAVSPVGAVELGGTINLTATVSPAQAGGTVKFYDGETPIGEAPVGENGVATLAWKPVTEGERTVRAVYSGAATVLPSAGTTQAVVSGSTDTPEPGEPGEPGAPGGGTGSLGSLTDSLAGGAGGAGSLSSLGS